MDPYQLFVELYVRSSDGHDDHAVSGSGDLSDGHGHSDAGHHGHAHPGTVLFLFVAIAVGGKKKSVLKLIMIIIARIVVFSLFEVIVVYKINNYYVFIFSFFFLLWDQKLITLPFSNNLFVEQSFVGKKKEEICIS